MKQQRILRIVRWIILLSILVLTTVLGRLHQALKLYPSIDVFCPFGGLESLWALIRYQAFLKRIAWSSFILLFTTVATAFAFRRSFCGNICPLGFLQEIIGIGGRTVLKKRFNPPPMVDRILRYAKYVVLIVFVGLAWKTLELAIRPYDPWVAYHHIGSEDLFSKNLIGAIILFVTLAVTVFMDRPFCRYLCPMGAFLAIPSKIGLFKIRRNSETCTSCGKCDKICPANIEVSVKDKITSAECLSCSECVNTCPVPDTLTYSVSQKGKNRSVWWVLGGTVLIFAAVLTVTTGLKIFVWKAETGLPPHVERLLWGPQKIGEDNTPVEILQIYKLNVYWLAEKLNLENEDQFYQTLKELNVDPRQIQADIEEAYKLAGKDPTQLLGGGGGGCGEDH